MSSSRATEQMPPYPFLVVQEAESDTYRLVYREESRGRTLDEEPTKGSRFAGVRDRYDTDTEVSLGNVIDRLLHGDPDAIDKLQLWSKAWKTGCDQLTENVNALRALGSDPEYAKLGDFMGANLIASTSSQLADYSDRVHRLHDWVKHSVTGLAAEHPLCNLHSGLRGAAIASQGTAGLFNMGQLLDTMLTCRDVAHHVAASGLDSDRKGSMSQSSNAFAREKFLLDLQFGQLTTMLSQTGFASQLMAIEQRRKGKKQPALLRSRAVADFFDNCLDSNTSLEPLIVDVPELDQDVVKVEGILADEREVGIFANNLILMKQEIQDRGNGTVHSKDRLFLEINSAESSPGATEKVITATLNWTIEDWPLYKPKDEKPSQSAGHSSSTSQSGGAPPSRKTARPFYDDPTSMRTPTIGQQTRVNPDPFEMADVQAALASFQNPYDYIPHLADDQAQSSVDPPAEEKNGKMKHSRGSRGSGGKGKGKSGR